MMSDLSDYTYRSSTGDSSVQKPTSDNGTTQNEDENLLNNFNNESDSSNKKSNTLDLLNNENNKRTAIITSTNYSESFVQNDLTKESPDSYKKNTKDSSLYRESQKTTKKHPIMGKTALLQKIDISSDSSIIHQLIFNKYKTVLNYYLNRMYTRRISRTSFTEEDSADSAQHSGTEFSSIDTLNFEDDTECYETFDLLESKEDDNADSSNDSDVTNNTDDVSTSEYDPREFLVNALGEDINLEFVENRDDTVAYTCEESIGSSRLSSLLSSKMSGESHLLTRTLKLNQLKERSKPNYHEAKENLIVEKFKEELSMQHSIIFQISKALNYCKASKDLFASKERVEAEKILLLATIKKHSLVMEINAIEFDTNPTIFDQRCLGEIQLSDITIHFAKTFQKTSDDCAEYYLTVVKCGKTVLSGDVIRKDNNTISVRGTFKFSGLQSNFDISLDVYCLVIRKKDYISQEVKCSNTKTLLGCKKNFKSTTDKHFIYAEASAFFPFLKCNITNYELLRVGADGNLKLKWREISAHSSVQSNFDLKINSSFVLTNILSGFLNVGVGIGAITWNRRWCILNGFLLKYWNYPSEEFIEPIEVINLKDCMVKNVEIADRSTCARPKTLFLPIKKARETKKYYLSADSQQDFKMWENELNYVVHSLLGWNAMNNYY